MKMDKGLKAFLSKQTRRQLFTFTVSLIAGKWWLMAIVSILCGIIVLLYTAFLITPMYAATAKVLALKSDVDITKVDQNIKVSKALLKDFVVLAKSEKTIDYVLKDSIVPNGYTEERILKNIRVDHNEDSNIISITVRDESAENAAYLANTVTAGLQAAINDLLLDTKVNYTQLSSVYEKAVVSTYPVYPNIPLSVGLALFTGFISTFFVVAFAVIMNNDIIAPEQIKLLTNLDTIGNVVMFDVNESEMAEA